MSKCATDLMRLYGAGKRYNVAGLTDLLAEHGMAAECAEDVHRVLGRPGEQITPEALDAVLVEGRPAKKKAKGKKKTAKK